VLPGTVADLLALGRLNLAPLDQVEPTLGTPLGPGLVVRSVRGHERTEIAHEQVVPSIVFIDHPGLDVAQTHLLSAGQSGLVERTYRVRLESGAVVARHLLAEDVILPVVPAQIARGTRPLGLETPFGRVHYVCALSVVATYYTPANRGKPPDSPYYGITATGAVATRGIVAVDPRVITLYSWYVPGYGIAQARDVGRAIIGDHIDVAFDDGDGAWWGRRDLTVYVLAP
jgi:3D (Asp-Asp-Asp) domain-containing protein